ncbi:bifunctional diguanylate cyclase/phosphodiesterase [Paenibacillus sp. S150]|uniref:putative bifunctional diguanylate cyclase/phosphodiesterase n=1 Tax=Paenibacillus sp. S150 TaxID=2749826 RepID=UPI001C5A1323|nr:EAL domain-containing protein [Paenibacillus sp. S150]MBW4082152.1 EAL domain-containing protein [Paenibacillus sp. S150]
MKLRKKIIIFICVVALLGLGVTYLLLHIIMLNRFEKLDEAALQDSMADAVSSFQDELLDMKTGLLNYSLRDETYRFAESMGSAEGSHAADDAFIRSSFDRTTYEVNHYDMIALLDLSGLPLYGGRYDASLGGISPLTPELLALFRLMHSRLPALSGAEDSRSGIVILDKGPMLLTLTPIVNNNKDKPVIGTAVAGRMLQQEDVPRIWTDGLSRIQISRATSGMLAQSGGKALWMSPVSSNMMSAHTVVNDLFGDPGVVITLQQPRQIYDSGRESVFSFRLVFLIVTIISCIGSMAFVNRSILGRMSSLISNIRAIGSSKDLSMRITGTGQDEFSDIEHEFNRMIDSLEQAREELRQQSMLDPLTQLPNRSLFFAKLNAAIDAVKGSNRQIVLVFIDLDHFKTVNDTLGHDFGDTMLKETAFRIKQVVGRHDVVSRLGGDEFTILLSNLPDSAAISAQLSRIREALSMPHQIKGHLLYNTASIGISIYPQNGEDADYLVRQADLAMLHVKETGRNNIFQYSEDLEESVRRKKVLAQLLLSAAANDEFEVHYQPILSAEHLQVYKVEALLRWTSPSYGMISPAEFIPLAETSGSIVNIGGWVLRQVCSDMRDFRENGLVLTAAVNISALQLMQPGLLELLLELLHEYGLPPSSLELEITESVLVSGDSIFQSLQQLRAHGFRISLDDFGTGFSSLSYLRRFPVDVIKIDRSFVSEMTPLPQGDVLVRAIIELSHNLGLRVVSEGIELQEQFDMLRCLGSDELQGYYISKPVRARELPPFLSQENLFSGKK